MRSMTRTAAVLGLLLSTSAQAVNMDWLTQYKKPNIHWGQLALHPYYQLTEVYDSNIYLMPRDKPGDTVGPGVRGSWITKNEVALEAVLPWRNLHNLSAGYGVDIHNYSVDARANDTFNQRGHLDYAYAGAYGLTFRAGDRYINTTDQASSQLVERHLRWANEVYTSLDYSQPNGYLTGGVDASHTANKYLDQSVSRQLNRYSQRVGFNVGYKILPKTKVYAAYHRGITHYTVGRAVGDQDKNSKSHDVALGLSGVIAPKVTGQVEAGMSYRQYDESPVGGVTRITRNMTAATNLVYKPTDRTDVILALSRGLQESVSASNRFYISNTAQLDVKHKLPYKFSVGGSLAFGLDKYPDTQFIGASGARGDRRDDIYQGGAWLEYDIQAWISTGVSYVFRERNSTFSREFNYQDQQTAWNLALKF